MAGIIAACSAGRGAGDPSSKYFSVHNALQSSGLTQQGGVNRAQLATGQSLKIPLDVTGQCLTIVALGGGEIVELEMQVADPEGKIVAKDDTRGPDATVRYCPEKSGRHQVTVKMVEGAGPFLISTWAGGQAPPGADAGSALSASATGAGTCESPILLVPGQSYVGETDEGRSLEEAGCASSNSREIVYRMDVPSRQRIVFDLDAQFDGVLYVRRADCTDRDAEVACNDDAGNPRRSKIDEVFEPGTYFVIVDGLRNEEGRFRLSSTVTAAPHASTDKCSVPPTLAAASTVSGDLAGLSDRYHASCGRGAKGPEMAWRFDLPTRSRVRFSSKTRTFMPVVYVRSSCGEESSEVACHDSGMVPGETVLATMLDAGAYWVFADAATEQQVGRFSLQADVAPEVGSGVRGDTCGDAEAIGQMSGQIDADTFAARDDMTVSCGKGGTADVVYRLDLGRKSHVSARVIADESRHVIALQKSCAAKGTELGCGNSIDAVVMPGTYFLVVDGAAENALGKARISWRIEDLTGADHACKAATPLVANRDVMGSTIGLADHFGSSCAGATDLQGSADRVYKFTLARRSEITAMLTTTSFLGALSIRKACGDPTSELGCSVGYGPGQRVVVNRMLEAGTYYMIVDGRGGKAEGDFTLRLDATPYNEPVPEVAQPRTPPP
jgi:hypothetical protein